MNPTTVEIVKSTAPVVKKNGQAITERMYEIAFDQRPGNWRFFVTSHMKSAEDGHQQTAKQVAAHANTCVIAEQFPVIGECLLASIKDVFGEAATNRNNTSKRGWRSRAAGRGVGCSSASLPWPQPLQHQNSAIHGNLSPTA